MRKRHLIIIGPVLILFVGLALTYRAGDKSDFDHYEEAIDQRFSYNTISNPSTYIRDCQLESSKGISFPMDVPAYARLHYDNLFKFPKIMTGEPVNSVLTILNDSSNYTWGELGTPEFYWHLTFYDQAGNCIGLTRICTEGQTYSTPHLAKTKWGLLTEEARLKLMRVFDD